MRACSLGFCLNCFCLGFNGIRQQIRSGLPCRAQVVGETTAGEMLSQKPFDLDGGYLLFLPIADYYSLYSGRIAGNPVEPDVPVDAEQALERALELARR